MACAKGLTIINAVKYLRKKKATSLKFLPKRLHHYLEKRILISSWYPEEDVLVILQVLAKIIPDPGIDVFEWQGRALAQSDLNGVYEKHFTPGDPANTLRKLSVFWGFYHDTGKERMIESDSNHVISEIAGFEYPSREICKTVVGWHAQLAEMAGGKDVESIHESCVMNGADVCRYIVRWKL